MEIGKPINSKKGSEAADGVAREGVKPSLALHGHFCMREHVHWWCPIGTLDEETALLMSDLFKRSSQNKLLSHGDALQFSFGWSPQTARAGDRVIGRSRPDFRIPDVGL
jgi:hypothetical protein